MTTYTLGTPPLSSNAKNWIVAQLSAAAGIAIDESSVTLSAPSAVAAAGQPNTQVMVYPSPRSALQSIATVKYNRIDLATLSSGIQFSIGSVATIYGSLPQINYAYGSSFEVDDIADGALTTGGVLNSVCTFNALPNSYYVIGTGVGHLAAAGTVVPPGGANNTGGSGGGVAVTNYSLETGGNLAGAAASLNTLNATVGTPSDAAFTSGAGTIVAVLKGIQASNAGVQNVRALTGATDTVQLAGGNTVAVKTDSSATTQPVSGAVTANIGTTNGLALDASIQTLIAAVNASNNVGIDGSVWVDMTTTPDTYYIRRESVTAGVATVTWFTPGGVVATPTVANLTQADAISSINPQSINFTATGLVAGQYAVGDVLIHAYGINTNSATATLAYSFWLNASQGTLLTAAPTMGTFAQGSSSVAITSLPLPPSAAQETGNLATVAAQATIAATQTTAINTSNTAIAAATGTTADTAYAGSGAATVVAALKGVYAAAMGVQNVRSLTAATDTVTVTATALPLPTGAATAALQPAINADGGAQVHVQNFPTTQAVSGTVTITPSSIVNVLVNPNGGAGVLTAIPAATTNGASLAALPTNMNSVRLYVPSGGSLTYTVATSQPAAAPTVTATIGSTTGSVSVVEPLSNGAMIYVTAVSGACTYRFV